MHRIFDFAGRVLIHLLLQVRMEGLQNFPSEGPVIMLINHINFLDVGILSVLMPRQPIGLAKEELIRTPVLGQIVRAYHVIPIKRGAVDRMALRRSQEVLREGKHVLMIAPEGHRSGNGRLQPAHAGIAFLAVNTNAIIVPVATIGGEGFWRNLSKLRRTPIRIVVGPAFRFSHGDDKADREMLRLMTTEAMYQLALLCPPAYRGVYSDISLATDRYLSFDI